MNIYKLKYASEIAAKKDIESKGIPSINDSIAWLGKLIDKPAIMDGMNIITPATYLSGYHVDILTDKTLTFASGIEQVVAHPKHYFWI